MPPPPAAAQRSPMPRGYEFVKVLGGGGCGWVALARQSALDRLVAVKTLYSGRYDEDERRRLEREGQALARLRDPHIVAVYAMEEVGENLALVIEYVDGSDLKQALEEQRLSGADLLRVLTQSAAGLDHAAAAGIVHRDIKPGNIMLTQDNRAKLTDFGLARLAASAGAFRTAGQVVIGTPRYMAPEQINNPELESFSGDSYSFACMVFEVLVGRPPFDATDAIRLFHAHTREAPPSPRSLRPALSADADAVLLAGLAKEPHNRPTPGQLMAALNRHPEDWQHIIAKPRPALPTPEPRAVVLPAPPSRSDPSATPSTTISFRADAVPWVEPPVYRPPATPDVTKRPAVPPVLVGALVGLLVVVIVALVLAR